MWDDIIEIVLDILLEGSMEVLPNKKLPKWIRFLAWIILVLFILGLIALGLYLLKSVLWLGTIFILLGVAFGIYLTVKMQRHDYLDED